MTEYLFDMEGEKAICQAEMLRNGLSTYSLWINIYVSSIGNLDTSDCFMTYEQAKKDLLSRTSEKGLLLDCGRYLAYVYSIVIVPYGVGSITSTHIDMRSPSVSRRVMANSPLSEPKPARRGRVPFLDTTRAAVSPADDDQPECHALRRELPPES